ncbi:Uncharacterized protein dnl_10210 [Desulfonema limicola]|uniref:PEP-CTERM sorting domain-containing protein n=1 Tax=Desulfonema limicola TaxID=45656 RepID=A0A975B4S6_9BACT|nr:hypothetical protein [Desulfonema limicola]QTA78786.1 Uncharacterized protein dnl_10210 [Desulfonema limicola]
MKNIYKYIIISLFLFTTSAHALSISTSGNGNLFDDNYSFNFAITQDADSTNIFHAALTNTTDPAESSALIDLLAFNLDAELNTDFTIENVTPDWSFDFGTELSSSIQFDYSGDRDKPGDRLNPGEILAFDFIFADTFSPESYFVLWADTESSLGKGIGGGDELGPI